MALVAISTLGIVSQAVASTKVYKLKEGESCEKAILTMNYDNQLDEAVRIQFVQDIGIDKVPDLLDLEKKDSTRHCLTNEYTCTSKDWDEVNAIATTMATTRYLCKIQFGCGCSKDEGCKLFVTTEPVFFFNRCETVPENKSGYKIVFK